LRDDCVATHAAGVVEIAWGASGNTCGAPGISGSLPVLSCGTRKIGRLVRVLTAFEPATSSLHYSAMVTSLAKHQITPL
jgi:hypothetical protein